MAKKNSDGNTRQGPGKMILGRTLFLMVVCGIVAFIVLAVQLYKVMIVKHNEYESMAVEQQVRETTISAARGTIYDSNMKILAMSATVETVFISPAEMVMYEEDGSMIASELSRILNVDYDRIMEMWADTDSWYSTVARKVEKETADQVRAFIEKHELKSVHLVEDTKRYYPYSTLASQVIGFVGSYDNNGLEGIEAKYNKYLEGVNGQIVRATTASGTEMLLGDFEEYYDAQRGNDVVLTIDSTIQYYLEKHLEQAVIDNSIQNGAMGIVMDVNTGAIRGLANIKNYDLNNAWDVGEETQTQIDSLPEADRDTALYEAQLKQWRNRVLSDTYEPGSTFKILTLAMALEEGVASEDDSFYCGGSIQVTGDTAPRHCWKTAGHGDQTLTQAAQHSCNVAFINLGMRLGAATFYDYVEAFGFFDTTGIDLSGEESGVWWSEEVFEDPQNFSQLAAASFGQTFTITPLQLITAVSAVANGGNLMEPYVVQRVLDENGDIVMEQEPTVIRQVISEETSKRACKILEAVVNDKEGTGKNAYVAGYRVAGKTGTSEKVTVEVQQGYKEYMVSFIGFAPADDPQVAVLIILDNPSKDSGIYVSGGVMAAPVVGAIMGDVLPYLGVEPEYTEEELREVDVPVPSLRGLSVEDAMEKLEAAGLKARVEGEGAQITDQLPSANVAVDGGTEVILYAGVPMPQNTVTMPDLTDLTAEEAKARLAEYGLFIRTTGSTNSSAKVVVAKQSVAASEAVTVGSVITVTLVDQSNLGYY